MKIDFEKLLLRANTHRVANAGLGGLVVAGAVHIAAAIAGRHDAQGLIPVALSALDSITLPFAMGSGAVAYLGRPVTVASKPTAEAMDAISKSPVAAAEVAAIAESVEPDALDPDAAHLVTPLAEHEAAWYARQDTKPSDAIPPNIITKGVVVVRNAPSNPPPPPRGPSGAHNAPASSVEADVPRPSSLDVVAAMLSHVLPAMAGGRLPMTLFEDLKIGETILGDIAAFASGKAVSQSGRIGSMNYTAEVQVLPSGPSGTPFQVLEGGPLALMSIAFADVASFSAGQPIKIAEKIGNTWYGTSFSAAAAPAAQPAAA